MKPLNLELKQPERYVLVYIYGRENIVVARGTREECNSFKPGEIAEDEFMVCAEETFIHYHDEGIPYKTFSVEQFQEFWTLLLGMSLTLERRYTPCTPQE
jgi:hypothetical protein